MVGALRQFAAVAALSLTAAACASAPHDAFDGGYGDMAGGARVERPAHPLQCVPYARRISGIPIYGDAWTWWQQAAGRYERGDAPQPGAVLVLDGYAGPRRAHLAVVRAVISDREIRVDHANWLDQGNIHLDDPVMDVSTGNDWSEVRVFNLAAGAWGTRHYHVRGFIGPGAEDDAMRVSDSE